MQTSNRCLLVGSILAVLFSTVLAGQAQERQMGGIGITIFQDANFRGKSATYQNDVPNLEPLGFNDKTSSIRVGRREQWEVCEHANYEGRCVVVSGEESDLRRNDWNDIISSMRRVRGGGYPGPDPGPRAQMTLFIQTDYRGNSMNYDEAVSDLYGMGRRAESISIARGAWELCEGKNFTLRCVILDRSVPDLRPYNLRHRISSARPVRSGGPTQPPDDWYIVLFDQVNYRGEPTNYSGPAENLNQRVRSVTIGRGRWELCDRAGRCVTLNRSVPNLRTYNIGNRISSVRPLRREPR